MPRRRGASIDSTVTVVLRSHRRSRRTLRLRGNTWHTLRPSGPRRRTLARRLAAVWHDGQYSASLGPQISGLTPAVSFRQEGRSRVVTNAGWDVVDARASARSAVAGRVEPRERLTGVQDERRFSVRQNRVVLTPVAGAKSAVANSNPTGLRSRKIRRRR
jgi:hypothetical protein